MCLEEFASALGRHEAAWLSLSCNRVGFVPGGPALIVSFMALADDDEPSDNNAQAIWGGSFLEARGHSILGVQRQRNDWYRAPDLHHALQRLAATGFFSRFERVMFYGGSMGGFAALAFASLAPGCIVLAHNPQSTLRPSATPWEGRFDFARQLDWEGSFSDGAEGARQAQVVYASYDPWCEEDRQHVDRLEGCRLVRLPFPHVGHQVPLWLQQLKVLGQVFDQALAGELTTSSFRTLIRGRQALPRYALQLTKRRIAPRRIACILEKARADHPHDAGIREALWDFTRNSHVAPTRETPRLVFWLHDMMDAQFLARELASRWPGLAISVDPLHAAERPTPLAALLRRPAHPPMVADEILRLLYGHPLVLHVVQPRSQQHCQSLDAMLLQTTASEGYRHVLFFRRHPTTKAHVVRAQWEALGLLGELMRARGCTPETVALDTPGSGRQCSALETWLNQTFGTGQTRPQLLPSPSLARPDLRHLPTPPFGAAAYQLVVQPAEPAQGRLHLDPMDQVFAPQMLVPLTGLTVPPKEMPATAKLVQYSEKRPPSEVRWGLASPGGPHRFPGHPQAKTARFGPLDLQVLPGQTTRLGWLTADGTLAEMATLHWQPLTARRYLPGLLWTDLQLGLLPLQSSGSAIVADAIDRALDDGRQPPLPFDDPAWYVDISAATHRFAMVADPVRRFRSLCNRLAVEIPALNSLSSADRMRWVIDHLQEAAEGPGFPWTVRFAGQAERIATAGPLTVLSWHDRSHAESWLSARLNRQVKLPSVSLRERWQSRLSTTAEVPQAVTHWILDRYAQDVSLYRGR